MDLTEETPGEVPTVREAIRDSSSNNKPFILPQMPSAYRKVLPDIHKVQQHLAKIQQEKQEQESDEKEIKLEVPLTADQFVMSQMMKDRSLPRVQRAREIPWQAKALIFLRNNGTAMLLGLGVASLIYLTYRYGFSGKTAVELAVENLNQESDKNDTV
jgi:hypothetical protein